MLNKNAKFSDSAIKILNERYLLKENGQIIETPVEMLRRVAKAAASIEPPDQREYWENQFFELLYNLDFLPNTPMLVNAGKPGGQLAACFTLPVEDSMDGIFEAVKWGALIHKTGGGTGYDFSSLRPEGSLVSSTGGEASGPISFMKVFNAATEAIKQGGVRRGANMGILRVDHPDILKFITCKSVDGTLSNFNISVAITDEFMQALKNNTTYQLKFNGQPTGQVLNARDVWNEIIKAAWATGEPGLIFIDQINAKSSISHFAPILATNPCGELPLPSFGLCILASINLSNFFVNSVSDWRSRKFSTIKSISQFIDLQRLERVVRIVVRFLDNIIDVNVYPLPQIEEMSKKIRFIGLGIMGLADLFYKLCIPYNSEQGVDFARMLMKFINETAYSESVNLAKDRGPAPVCPSNTTPVRNMTRTAIAPTGTLAMLAGVNYSCEPYFALSYTKTVLDGVPFKEVNKIFEAYAKQNGFYSEELMRLVEQAGSIQNIVGIPQTAKEIFVTAMDISPEWHIRMQAALQEFTDNAVSKTINLPFNATTQDVEKAYLLAYELGCKGITVYRDGSRSSQPITVGTKTISVSKKRPRPDITYGYTQRAQVGCGRLYITVNHDDQGICEVFTTCSKGGGCPSQSEATARLVSLIARHGIPIDEVVEELKGIRCMSCIRKKGLSVTSCPDAIAKALELDISKPGGSQISEVTISENQNLCPICGKLMIPESGCWVCICGYSKCG